MKKTFRDLRPGDKFWHIRVGSYEMEDPHKAYHISAKTDQHTIYFYTRTGSESVYFSEHNKNKITDLDKTWIKWENGNNEYCLFCNEVEYLRYRKAQGMKYFLRLIEQAKNSVNAVKRFRAENFEDLNKNWLESEINKLEKATA